MNPKDPLNLPPLNWDKWLPRIALFMVGAFILALLTRIRTLIIAMEILDVLFILGLLCAATYGIIRKYGNPPPK